MGYEWTVHLLTFLILVSYRGSGARYRVVISLWAAALTGLSFALTLYSLIFPPPVALSIAGLVLLLSVLRCRGNVAKLFRQLHVLRRY
jgi:putative effector of murein hydrolase LrgA (UPF0299 family)